MLEWRYRDETETLKNASRLRRLRLRLQPWLGVHITHIHPIHSALSTKVQARAVTGRFAPFSVRPMDFSPPGRFATWIYSTFPTYSFKTQVPSFGCFNYSCHSVRISCWIKRLLTCLLTYQGPKRPGANWPGGETSINLVVDVVTRLNFCDQTVGLGRCCTRCCTTSLGRRHYS